MPATQLLFGYLQWYKKVEIFKVRVSLLNQCYVKTTSDLLLICDFHI